MRTVRLSGDTIIGIADGLIHGLDFYDGSGSSSYELTEANVAITAEMSAEVEDYQDNDYFNGTGTWITTDAHCNIESIVGYDIESGEDVRIEADIPFMVKYITDYLLTH